jgi:hypothetical protein
VGGVSVAGFRPGLGRGGMIHSFLVTDVRVSAGGDADAEGDGAGASDGGEAAEVAIGGD